MKTNNIFKVVLCSMFAMSLAACVEEAYVPAPVEDSSKTYVRADETAPRNLDVDGSDIMVPFVRTNTSGAMDVTVALADTSGIFTLNSTTITVAMTTEDAASQYSAVALPMTCKKAWQNLGMAQWYDDWWIGGPFEKQLLKAPDGTETYRLINPWDKQSVIDGGLDFVSELPYLEFVINEDGSISWGDVMNLGFTFSGKTCHHLHPSKQGNAEAAAMNVMVMENVAQFCWYPILNFTGSSFSWWGSTAVAYISFPGGPDLAELLGL